MQKRFWPIVVCLLAFGLAESVVIAQSPSVATLEAMQKVRNLFEGEWQGEGWSQKGPGPRQKAIINEKVQAKLNGTILMVEGLGKTPSTDGGLDKIVHNAFGIISYDETAKIYRLKTYLENGQSVDAEATLVDGVFQWRFQTPQGFKMRYTVTFTPKGEWNEVGDFSKDGSTRMRFHEMTLQKVK